VETVTTASAELTSSSSVKVRPSSERSQSCTEAAAPSATVMKLAAFQAFWCSLRIRDSVKRDHLDAARLRIRVVDTEGGFLRRRHARAFAQHAGSLDGRMRDAGADRQRLLGAIGEW